jgi:hypothetical protein
MMLAFSSASSGYYHIYALNTTNLILEMPRGGIF